MIPRIFPGMFLRIFHRNIPRNIPPNIFRNILKRISNKGFRETSCTSQGKAGIPGFHQGKTSSPAISPGNPLGERRRAQKGGGRQGKPWCSPWGNPVGGCGPLGVENLVSPRGFPWEIPGGFPAYAAFPLGSPWGFPRVSPGKHLGESRGFPGGPSSRLPPGEHQVFPRGKPGGFAKPGFHQVETW